jgi:hypothetical protein
VEGSFGALKTIKALGAFLLGVAILECTMSNQPERVLGLLKSSGAEIRSESTVSPAVAPSAKRSWTYTALGGRVTLHIYEFNGQEELDEAASSLENTFSAKNLNVSFAQNGEYLLVVTSAKELAESDSDLEYDIDRILAAFSGEVER